MENVELARRFFAAWNQRDFDALDAVVIPDFEYHGLAEWPGLPRVVRGLEELRRRLASRDAELDEFQLEQLELIDAGERVVVVFEVRAIGKLSRAPVRFTDASVVTVRDGRIVRIDICGTREKALELAGLGK